MSGRHPPERRAPSVMFEAPTRLAAQLPTHLFARRVEQDVDHSAAQTLLDWDWLGGGDGLAELGDVTSPTARALSTRFCVTSRRRRTERLLL